MLLKSITQHIALSESEQEGLKAHFKIKKIKKKHFYLQEGDVQQFVTFVSGGCMRSYSIDENGVEHILQFAPTGWWIADMHSILNQTPATLNIDAVEDSELLLIRRTDLEKLYDSIPQLNRFFRILTERSLASFQHRLIDGLSLTALARYNNFCERYPTLIQALPQKYVASYIGITPEFLSKMLSQPMKKR
ncbi:MAG TPA: Crp/Fnr family transcriptional regulator [Niabella sp.]|nr:Crp/Fnr family transcriptional regulator [Niabella sp.]